MDKKFRIERLFALCESEYRNFMSGLLPTVDKESIIGVRMPTLRKIAAEISRMGDEEEFFSSLPHRYYEENAIHAYLICCLDGERCANELERFLPFVDNWGICDSLRPSAKNLTLEKIYSWLESEHVYTVRFAPEMLMLHYLGDKFSPEMPQKIASLRNGEYYLDMMVSWYFATALACRYEEILPYITERRLSPWIHNKTISKACESHRIEEARKIYLKNLKIKLK